MITIKKAKDIIKKLKNEEIKISSLKFEGSNFYFKPFNLKDLENDELINILRYWREINSWVYPSVFPVTLEGTKNWLKNLVINNTLRVLFGIYKENILFGHIGYLIRNEPGTVELDNILRGRKECKGVMTKIVSHFVENAYKLGFERVVLKVFGDNVKAIKLYKRCNFIVLKAIPTTLEFTNDGYKWIEQGSFDPRTTFRIFLEMEHKRT